jgi:hypothetical protein
VSPLSALAAAAAAADRDLVRLCALATLEWPAWGRLAAMAVRDGPTAVAFLWAVDALLLPPAADRARASRLGSLTVAVALALAWAVAWVALPTLSAPPPFPFAPAAASQAAASRLPLGAAVLALAAVDGGGVGAALMRLAALGYALARVAVGADAPVEAVAEALSAASATLAWQRTAAHRAETLAAALSRALGLSAVPDGGVRGREGAGARRS